MENVLNQGILLGKMATAAVPILTILLMVQPAKAWEKSTTVGEFETSDYSVPKLTIDSQVTHKIQEGDTLWELSRLYDISPQELATYNDISLETVLQVGETLEIPTNQLSNQEKPQLVVDQHSAASSVVLASNMEQLSLGGVGGAAPSDDLIMVQALNDNKTVTAIPQIIAQDLVASNIPSEKSQAPVQDFLADVKQLQSQYQEKHLEFDHSESEDKTREFSPADSSSGLLETDSDSLASAPIKIEFYNRFLNLPLGKTVSPELPPLSSPEQYLPEPGQQFNGYIWPAEGVFTSGYGQRWGRMHRGIDIAGPIGTPILAAATGEVIFAGWNNGGYGKLVKLKHPDESITLYAHNNRILVQQGQEVDQGQQIAEMGNTGRSTGPHLHFEIRPHEQEAVNPLAHLPSGSQVRKGQKITDQMNSKHTSRR
ncbi:MAG: peptidoglycan DD-metalloendopeptidase family protein [Halothece sp.]